VCAASSTLLLFSRVENQESPYALPSFSFFSLLLVLPHPQLKSRVFFFAGFLHPPLFFYSFQRNISLLLHISFCLYYLFILGPLWTRFILPPPLVLPPMPLFFSPTYFEWRYSRISGEGCVLFFFPFRPFEAAPLVHFSGRIRDSPFFLTRLKGLTPIEVVPFRAPRLAISFFCSWVFISKVAPFGSKAVESVLLRFFPCFGS